MRFSLSTEATRMVANTSPRQTWFFVLSDRGNSAEVVEAHIAVNLATRKARATGGCVRVGRVVRDSAGVPHAETI